MISCLFLSAILQSGGASMSDSVTISGKILPHTAPYANFTAYPRSGYVPFSVQFTDTSNGSPTSWSWDFQNDSIVDSNEQNPVFIYSSPGLFSVNLRVSNAYGSDIEIKTVYIKVNPSNPAIRINALKQYSGSLSIPIWSKWLLTTPLRSAENALDRGNERAAILYTRSFIENVRVLRLLRIITKSQSEYMISEANAVLSMIQQ